MIFCILVESLSFFGTFDVGLLDGSKITIGSPPNYYIGSMMLYNRQIYMV